MTQRTTPRLRAVVATAAIAATAAALAACGGSGSSGTTLPADVDLTVVAVDGIAWDKKEYSVTTTDGKATIGARNDSSIAHDLHLVGPDGVRNPTALDLPRRGSVAYKEFTLSAGTYTIICTVPGHANMRATLDVS